MKILVFGASGGTGHYLVSQARGSGHVVSAFIRDTSNLKVDQENIKIIQGDVTEYQSVENAITDQEVILSALGASSPFKRDVKLIQGIQNIVTAMTKQHVKRFIYQSFLGVRENRNELGFLLNTAIPALLRNVVADHEEKENIIATSGCDWTIVRCPMLTNGSFTGNYRTGEHIVSSSLLPTISRADVADFMLEQMTDRKYFYKKPRILH